MIAASLRAAGNSVGQFTSPHLQSATERCIVNGEPVSEDSLNAALLEVKEATDSSNLNPSFFEIVAAASFLEFQRRGLDWAVVEVGLGGRLDATNTMKKPRVSVITSIGYDHTHILGETLDKIATEKAGIMRPGVPVFVGLVNAEVKETLLEVAKRVGAPISFVSPADVEALEFDVALNGMHQRANAALAVAVANHLELSSRDIASGLQSARWPGRLELIDQVPSDLSENMVSALLDGAHNVDGVASLLSFLKAECENEPSYRRIVFVLAMLDRKNWKETICVVRDFAKSCYREHAVTVSFVFTRTKSDSSVPPSILQREMGAGISEVDCREALNTACSLSPEVSRVVICGSIYLLGELRGMLVKEPFRTISES
jgi:dihydrofolate synthase/folylpolyglutamate synthase